jgi:hypothetical protein
MAKPKPGTISDRIAELKLSRRILALALGVGERSVYRWLAYTTELRLNPDQYADLCTLLKWGPGQLATAYRIGSIAKKNAPGPAVAPGQISLLD